MEEATPSGSLYGERGAGGKLRKASSRKPPATPYDRPSRTQSSVQPSEHGWLSKLVDPAYRLIAAGATKILPSFLSRSPSTPSLLLPITDDDDEADAKLTLQINGDEKDSSSFGLEEFAEGACPTKVTESLMGNSEVSERGHDEIKNVDNNSEFSKIEQLVKGKRFSRDEIDHLLEILNTRVADISHAEREMKNTGRTVGRDAGRGMNNPGLTVGRDAEREMNPGLTVGRDAEREMNPGLTVGRDAEREMKNPGLAIGRDAEFRSHLKLKKPVEHEEKDANGTMSNMQMGVGASPVDIARAYMGTRTSELGRISYDITSTSERNVNCTNHNEAKPQIHLTTPKSSTCWTGAILQDQIAYTTPRNVTRGYGLHNFPRSPYSRTIFSKSKANLQADRMRPESSCKNTSSPFCSQLKSRGNVIDDHIGSGGPIRRIRHEFVSEATPRGSIFRRSSQSVPSPFERSSAHKDLLYTRAKNFESSGTSDNVKKQPLDHLARTSEADARALNPSTSESVRRILEQLDRKMPTLKEKAAELKLATAWRKHCPDETDSAVKEVAEQENIKKIGSKKDLGGQKMHPKSNGNGVGSFSTVDGAHTIFDTNALPSSTFQNSFHYQKTGETNSVGTENMKGGTNYHLSHHNEVNGHASMTAVSNSGDFMVAPKRLPYHFSGNKLSLTSISIKQLDFSNASSSGGFGSFTFPVSVSSTAFSEPPTPSVMPSIPVGGIPQTAAAPDVPSYSFGSRSSGPRLVFSFPSTSSGSLHIDTSDPKFSFGSDGKSRLSFNSFGRDAVCC